MENQALIPLELILTSDKPANLSAQIKNILHEKSLALNSLFWQDADMGSLLYTRSLWHDEILGFCWQLFDLNKINAAIIAVGGYGRSRLHPYSDIDIVILIKAQLQVDLPKIEKFIAFCWDSGLKLGASVRTVNECIKIAEEDLSVYTSLLNARFVTGTKTVFDVFIKSFNNNQNLWPFDDFFKAKCEERQQRYAHYLHTEYSLEPNLKDSPGGLRDIDLIEWLCIKKYNDHDISRLVQQHELTQDEYQSIISAQKALWKMRYALHLVCGSHTERLYFEHQATLTKQFSIKRDSLNQAIADLMQPFYQTASTVREITSLLCQHYEEQYRKNEPKGPLIHFCEIADGYLHISQPQDLDDSTNLMQLFYIVAKLNLTGFTSTTNKAIKHALKTRNDSYFDNENAHLYFLKILNLPQGVASTLNLMQRLSVLSGYIPEFQAISCQMQYDLFHLYTVDAHTLMLVGYLEKFYQSSQFDKFPYATQCKEFAHQDILYLTALFHDIGKGRGGNHSHIGAKIAYDFCQKIHLEEEKTTLISWLVENHLVMSHFAQTKDIYDDKVIQEFVKIIQTKEKLSYLYLFTVADMLATNPSLWNDWRASLLQELYLSSKLCLESTNLDVTNIHGHQTDAMSILQLSGIKETDKVLELWSNFDENYFNLETSANIAWQTSAILQQMAQQKVFTIALREHHNKIGMNIFIYAPDKPNLFAVICSCLEKAYLNIVQARIHHTKNNFTSMSFVALEIAEQSMLSRKRIEDIYQYLFEALSPATQGKDYLLSQVTRHVGRLKHRSFTVTINLHQENNKTILHIKSPDFPGLLARIAEVFMRLNLLVHSAIVNTLEGQVEDVFYITNKSKTVIEQEEIEKLRNEVNHAILEHQK